MLESLRQLGRRHVVEPLLLREARRVSGGYAPDQRARVRELALAAHARLDASNELREDNGLRAALALQREAMGLATTAVLVARGEQHAAVLAPHIAMTRLRTLLESQALGKAPDELEAVERVLDDPDVLATDRLDEETRRATREAFDIVLRWLLRRVEWRNVRELRVRSAARIAALVVALAVALVVLLTLAFKSENVARGKPVQISSRRPGTPNPAGAVDGEKDGHFGFHTNLEDGPWLRIDLQQPYAIKTVVVYNRGDGYEDQVLPLAIELSEDGKNWREVSVRTARFTESSPWKANLHGARGRHVQLKMKKRGFLWGSEVEVFGTALGA